jgi:alanyl-tRNA synthetase
MIEILDRLNDGRKAYFRGGNVLKDVLLRSKEIVSGEDALLVFNTYGISSRELNILFFSHGLEIHNESYAKLLEDQEKRMKNCVQC